MDSFWTNKWGLGSEASSHTTWLSTTQYQKDLKHSKMDKTFLDFNPIPGHKNQASDPRPLLNATPNARRISEYGQEHWKSTKVSNIFKLKSLIKIDSSDPRPLPRQHSYSLPNTNLPRAFKSYPNIFTFRVNSWTQIWGLGSEDPSHTSSQTWVSHTLSYTPSPIKFELIECMCWSLTLGHIA